MSEPRVPLTDAEIEAAEWNVYNGLLPDVDIIAELRATRAELATLRGVVRDAVELLRDEATFWHELYPAWLVHALLGEDAAITKQWNGVNNLNMARQRKAIRALVAAAGEDSDA